MGDPVDLIIDRLTREKISIELPPRFRVPPEGARRELGLPDFVDLSDPLVAKAVSLAYWASRQPNGGPPIAFLGGVAHRLRCPASNDPASGLMRPLHDIDLACLHKQIRPTMGFLKSVRDPGGSALTFFETPGDRTFNALTGGRRQRLHTVVGAQSDQVELAITDILADEFSFCHTFDLRADVQAARTSGWTISPTLLLLAKLQFIQRIPASNAPAVQDRVLEPFGKHEVLIGLEPKDSQDVLAVLRDLPVGERGGGVSRDVFSRMLLADWGLWRTVGLNLRSIARSRLLAGLPDSVRSVVVPKLGALEEAVQAAHPRRRFTFGQSQWWQEVDSPGNP